MTIVQTPAKLIISGEHAVLYNRLAITCAVDRYTECIISRNDQLNLGDDFIHYIISEAIIYFNITDTNFAVDLKSQIVQRSGFGSSAALVVSILVALRTFYNFNIPNDDMLEFARKLENIKHGNSSGIDIQTVYHGGVLSFASTNSILIFQRLNSIMFSEITIIHTGSAKFSTADVVSFVGAEYSKKHSIWQDFSGVTKEIHNSLLENNMMHFNNMISANQILLEKIGIVPEKVSSFIKELVTLGIYAKVCGAGTIAQEDEGCGVLAIFHSLTYDMQCALQSRLVKYGYTSEKVQIDQYGTIVK